MRRSDVLDVVRDVNPMPDPDLLVDPAVRTSTLERVLDSEGDRAPAGRWRRRRLPLLGILAPLVVASAAFAASQILSGTPYRPPWSHRAAQSDMGVPIAASIRLLPLRVPDADGGPPWGMRIMRTTRGDECMQVGRVVGGRLGVLGQDGIFRDDHRFHPLPPSVFEDYNCALIGTGGYAVIGNWSSIHASGLDAVGTCSYPGGPRPVCRAGDLRLTAYGLVGPDARAITVRERGTTRAITPVAREGAYLVVRHEARVLGVHGSSAGGSGLAGGGGPGSFPGAVAIVYRDGSTCPTADPPGNPSCVYDRVSTSVPSHLHLRRVRVRVAGIRPDPMFKDEDRAVLRFTAPVTVSTSALDYTAVANNPGVAVAMTENQLGRDVHRGTEVTWVVDVPRCTRTARVRLYLGRTTPLSESGHGLPAPLATLAKLTLRLPPARPPAWCAGPGSRG